MTVLLRRASMVLVLCVGLCGQPVQAQAPESVERVRSRIDVLRDGPERGAQAEITVQPTAEEKQIQPPTVTPRDLTELEARIVSRIETAITEAFNRERLRALLRGSESRQRQEYRPAQRTEERTNPTVPPRRPPRSSSPPVDSVQSARRPSPARDTVVKTPTVRSALPETVIETRIVEVERAFFEAGVFRAFEVNFGFGESRILPRAYRTLDAVGAVLEEYPQLRVRIEGHTDSVGTATVNERLSDRRAEAVRRYLIETFDVAPHRLVSQGYGETRPVANNETRIGRELNRRVEFVLLNPEAATRQQDSSESQNDD